ncbi:hypothetical protein FRC02_005911 [Tulasnella sp. 418]|nr:hypothetical protein FRC02_005911 [Tulasnella sp. 418]
MPDYSNTRKKPSKLKRVGSWEIGRTIGKGSSGHVRIARHIATGQFAAIKIVSKRALISSRMSMSKLSEEEDKILQSIEREIVIMKLIDHPNILRLYDVWETKNELYLVLEYVEGGELFDHLVQSGRLSVAEALHYFQQIISAVNYCHGFNIAHRDLKPENLLIDKDRNIKVADFGMAAWEAGGAMLATSCGSPHYASPEVIAGDAYHGSVSDIWSCGVILYALLVGRLPFDDDNVRVLLEKVKEARFSIPVDVDPRAKDLIGRMLEKDVNKRITMEEIMEHPFVLSRPPRPMRQAILPPPTLHDVERPVESVDDIDPDIFGNLKALWRGAKDEDIIDGLMSDRKTWEKAIYHLLLKYRAKSLENYNMDSEDEPKVRREASQSRAEKYNQGSAPSPLPLDTPSGTPNPRAPPVTPLISSTNQPPTPKRNDSPVQSSYSEVPTPGKVKTGAHSDSNSGGESLESVNGAEIQLAAMAKLPTPVADTPSIGQTIIAPVRPGSPYSQSPTVHQPASPHLVDSPAPTSSPILLTPLTPLTVPQVENEAVQLFFRQIAEQLNLMQMRQAIMVLNSGANPNSPSPLQSPDLHALAMAALNYAASPVAQSYFSTNSPFINGATSLPSTPTDLPQERQTISNNGNSTQGGDVSYGLGISSYEVQSSNRAAPRPPLRHMHTAPVSSRRGLPTREAIPPTSRTRSNSHGSDGSNKENPPNVLTTPNGRPRSGFHHAPKSGQAEGLKPRSSIRLDGAPRRAALGERHVQIVLPQEDPEWTASKLKRRMSVHDPLESPSPLLEETGSNLSTPDPNGGGSSFSPVPSLSGPKRSWFTNLFNFKPASYSLLSLYDAQRTRDECKKLLRDQGVVVLVQNSDALSGGILKCRLDEIRDPAGVMSVVKAVRFRVEFHQTSGSHAATGYITSATLIQEKGALSSFKLLFNRLRREWELDSGDKVYHHNPTHRQVDNGAGATAYSTLRLVTPRNGGGSPYVDDTVQNTHSTRNSDFLSPVLRPNSGYVDPRPIS